MVVYYTVTVQLAMVAFCLFRYVERAQVKKRSCFLIVYKH